MEDVLEGQKIVWLATCRPDGRPHLTPIWRRFVGGRFWMCTTENSVKVRNLRANPSCSVALGTSTSLRWRRAWPGCTTGDKDAFPAAVVAAFAHAFDWDIDNDDEGYNQLIEIEVRRWLYRPPSSGAG